MTPPGSHADRAAGILLGRACRDTRSGYLTRTICCCCGCIGATLRTSREFSVFTLTWRMPVDDTIFWERAFWPNRTWKGALQLDDRIRVAPGRLQTRTPPS